MGTGSHRFFLLIGLQSRPAGNPASPADRTARVHAIQRDNAAIESINRLNYTLAMSRKPAESTTRANLIDASLYLFGRKGYDGTSTRELAARAGTNVASIAYHFGGKAGLRAACAGRVAEQVSAVLDAGVMGSDPPTPQAASAQIEMLAGAFVRLIVGAPQARDMVAFMLRELTDPGEVADTLYTAFVEPRHIALCGLWATATGRSADDEEIKLAIFAMIGQVLYFRLAQPFVARRMEWDDIGTAETRQIADVVIANLRDSIERLRL